MKHFNTDDLPSDNGSLTAISSLLYYLHQTMKCDLSHINRITQYNAAEYLIIDTSTLRNLEITRNIRDGGKKGTLLSVLDFTKTAMGGRLLKNWLEYPLFKIPSFMILNEL
jgi:DNA mismatch repair protein MutS